MAKATLRQEFTGVRAHVGELGVIAAVTTVTARGGGKQPIGAIFAGPGALVTGGTGHLELCDVLLVIEAQGEPLERKDGATRTVITGESTRRPIRFGQRRATGTLG